MMNLPKTGGFFVPKKQYMNKKVAILKKPISASVSIPGSKSVTNRALLIASLCEGKIILRNALASDDTLAMTNCLKKMGVKISKRGNTITVHKKLSPETGKTYKLHAGLSGTTLRFLLPILCATPGDKIIVGFEGLNRRPIKDLVDALTNIGAKITPVDKNNQPPLFINGSYLSKKPIKIRGTASSQYLSSLLMMLPTIGGGTIEVTGKLVSKPYVDLTIAIMKDFGVFVKNDGYRKFTVSPSQTYSRKKPYVIEGDVSSACYFAALAVLTGSKIHIKNINPKSLQGDKLFFGILKDMGNKIQERSNSVFVEGIGVIPINVDMETCPDQVQTLSVLAAFANGKTVVSGIQTLRLKETNRVAAIQNELKKMGIKTHATAKKLTIFGGMPIGAEIETYGDHRMAMSFALAGTKIAGLSVKDPMVVKKTFPDFWSKMRQVGVQ